MQIKADFTKEELLNHYDIFAEVCHPIGKIKLLADMLWCLDKEELVTGNVINQDNILTLSGSLKDACEEIEYLIDISNEQWRQQLGEYPKLKMKAKGYKDLCKGFFASLPEKASHDILRDLIADFRAQVERLEVQYENI